MMRKLLCMLICLCLAGAAAAEGPARTYAAFEASYAENIVFINDNAGRHLLPHTPLRDYDTDGNRLYRIDKGALSAVIRMDDLAETIESCQITLTAPADMKYGSPQHNDFNTAGYHSYALIMAMDESAAPHERYALITRISEGLAATTTGIFETQVGDYHLTCTSANGIATMLFENELLKEQETEIIVPAEDEAEETPSEEDEFLG